METSENKLSAWAIEAAKQATPNMMIVNDLRMIAPVSDFRVNGCTNWVVLFLYLKRASTLTVTKLTTEIRETTAPGWPIQVAPLR